MIAGVHTEVFLAIVYACFLVGVAGLLELLARHAYKRSERYRTSGFIYFSDLDYWECPAGHQLVQLKTNQDRRVTLYRAPASACNACPLKLNCTDSDAGRVLEMRLDTWIESELRRFHRALSLALLVLATVLLLAEACRYAHLHDCEALAAVLVPIGVVQFKLLPSLRFATKAG
jgi:hypothetical protein